MSKKKLCEICGVDPAAVPDRDKPWSPSKRVCLSCHSARLRGDLDHILTVRLRRKEALR